MTEPPPEQSPAPEAKPPGEITVREHDNWADWLWHEARPWLLFVLALLVLALPWIVWWVRAPLALDVLVLDKTVPTAEYREHRALFWVMEHLKVVDPETGAPYRIHTDYYGVHPGEAGYRIRPIPSDGVPSDLVYLADTYGVYPDPLEQADREDGSGLPVEGYGGLQASDVPGILRSLRPGGVLVAEFNTLSSPTPAGPRREMEALLGVRWTGWTGRRFESLGAAEVPEWMPRNWVAANGAPWSFVGPGYVLASDDGRVVVLLEGVDVGGDGVRITADAGARSAYGIGTDVRYDYWLSIVVPDSGTEVVARYELPVDSAARARLDTLGIPATFPAITTRRLPDGATAYYLAGDFADTPDDPWLVRTGGLTRLRQAIAWGRFSFFWKVYVPFMRTVLDPG